MGDKKISGESDMASVLFASAVYNDYEQPVAFESAEVIKEEYGEDLSAYFKDNFDSLSTYFDKPDEDLDYKFCDCRDAYREKLDVENYYVIGVMDDDGVGESGFYGVTFGDPETHHYEISFRGSNDNGFPQVLKPGSDEFQEWINTDGSFLNSDGELPQPLLAAKYAIDEMARIKAIDPNATFTFTGHSLGGYLSYFAAIYIAENYPDLLYMMDENGNIRYDENGEPIWALKDTFGFDSPNFAWEMLIDKYKGIDLLYHNRKLHHKAWSGVGFIMDPLDEKMNGKRIEGYNESEYAKVEDKGHNGLGYLEFDEEGSMITCDKSELGPLWIVKEITSFADRTTTGNLTFGVLLLVVYGEGALSLLNINIAKLALIFPEFAPIILSVVAIVGTIQGLLVIALVAYVVVKALDKFIRLWRDIQANLLNGNYQVKYSFLLQAEQELISIGARINNVYKEVDSVLCSIEYESASGSYAKRGVREANDHIYDVSTKMSKAGACMAELNDCYSRGDDNVAGFFCRLS